MLVKNADDKQSINSNYLIIKAVDFPHICLCCIYCFIYLHLIVTFSFRLNFIPRLGHQFLVSGVVNNFRFSFIF